MRTSGRASLLPGVFALLLVGCTGDRPAEGAVPPTAAPTPAPAAQADAPTVAPQPGPAEPVAPENQTRRELGAPAVAIVERADTVGAARMRVVAAQKAEEEAMSSDKLIGGYPIEAPLVPLDAATRDRLLRTILDDANYEYGLARRCANDYFVGVRFQRGPERVEFVLGVGCMQAFWSTGSAGDVHRSGGPMTEAAGKSVLGLLADAGVRNAMK